MPQIINGAAEVGKKAGNNTGNNAALKNGNKGQAAKSQFTSGLKTQDYALSTASAIPAKQPQTAKIEAAKTETPKPKKKLPDFAPREQDWNEELLPVNSGNMYMLVETLKNNNLDELVKDQSVPILVFTGTLLQEIRYITSKLSNSEYAVFLALRRIDDHKPHFLAYDFFMPEQTASSGGVALDPKDCQRHFDALKSHPYYKEHGLHRHLCHLHSHASMGVFWSGTDDTQQLSRDDLGFMDDFRFYCVVNTKEEIKCSFVFYKPVLARVDAAVAVSFSGADHAEQLTRKRKAELDEMMETAVSSKSYANQWSSEFDKAGFGKIEKGKAAGGAGQGCESVKDAYAKYADDLNRGGDYWDRFHGQYSGKYSQSYGRDYSGWGKQSVDKDEYWDSKNWANPANQPISLGWFSFLENYKGAAKISDSMLQEFLASANVDRKYAKIARKIIAWALDDAFDLKNHADEFDLEGEEANVYGSMLGEYINEFVLTMRNSNAWGEDFEDKQYLSERTCHIIKGGNKDRIIEAVIADLATLLMDGLE